MSEVGRGGVPLPRRRPLLAASGSFAEARSASPGGATPRNPPMGVAGRRSSGSRGFAVWAPRGDSREPRWGWLVAVAAGSRGLAVLVLGRNPLGPRKGGLLVGAAGLW